MRELRSTGTDHMRRVFITGIGSGLGLALAKEFLSRGDAVWGVGKRPEAPLDAASFSGRLVYTPCDVTRRGDVEALRATMEQQRYLPDIVVLNAGVSLKDSDGDFDAETFEDVFAVNVFGATRWVAVFLPAFLARGKGDVVAISSLAAYRGVSNRKISYPSSKAALSMAMESLRLQYAGTGVRFITVCPGPLAERGDALFTASFEKAARRIVRHIKGSTLIQFRLAPALLFRLSRLVPDVVLGRIIQSMTRKSSRRQ